MKITAKIAWRNIWRNPRRTWVLVSSVAVGMFAHLSIAAFNRGSLNQMIESAINLDGGHVVVLPKGYQANPRVQLCLHNPDEFEARLNGNTQIAHSPKVSLQGMVNSPETATGVAIIGVDPDKEQAITIISRSITSGSYLSSGDSKPEIVIGEALAHKLNVHLGEKIVLMISDIHNEISSAAFRVTGLFATPNPDFEKRFVYINLKSAESLAGYKNEITGYSIRLAENAKLEDEVTALKNKLKGEHVEVLSWKDRNPLLVISLEMFDTTVVVVAIIMFVAIAFTIANSFLMVIYERIQELGIMMANGVLPKRIRRMLYVEASFITAIGSLLGLFMAVLLVGYYGSVGLDLASFADGLGRFGLGTVIYPEFWAFDIGVGIVGIFGVAFISVLYPAIKASRFQVVDAIRFV